VVELIPLVAIICIFVVLPGMVMYFADRKRRWQHENAANKPASGSTELLALAERMEKRIDALEQILDVESPGWRKKYHEHA
jgi:phage shock protein B